MASPSANLDEEVKAPPPPTGTIRRRFLIPVALIFLTLRSAPAGFAGAQTTSHDDTPEAARLMERVGPPSQPAIEEFKKAGMEQVTPHTLTPTERATVQAALASLPPLHRAVLAHHLHSLAFVDGIPGEGTGLTSPAGSAGSFDITLRASILNETLTTFLTVKEHRVFQEDGSGTAVSVTGTGTDALTYVLLHESTHIVDKSCGLTADPKSPLLAGIWMGPRAMVAALASQPGTTTYFHGGRPVPLKGAASIYDSLSRTPFVSLYATASAQEDLAELVAWRVLLLQHHGDLTVTVSGGSESPTKSWHPLTFPGVQRRFPQVDQLLAASPPCAAGTER